MGKRGIEQKSTSDITDPTTNGITNQISQSTSANAESDRTSEEQDAESVFQINIKLPHEPYEIQIMVSTQEQVQDLRASIVDLPSTFQYTCFHLEHNGERINDFVELAEIKGLVADSALRLVEDPYTEKEARVHAVRIRELIGAAGDRVDTLHGISCGLSLHDTVAPSELSKSGADLDGYRAKETTTKLAHAMEGFSFDRPPFLQKLLPPEPAHAPKTLKAISVSPWNPPPHYLRQKGHLLYLQVTTNEGEQHQITSHVSGFFVNKSSNSKFDPHPKAPPKDVAAHSLLTLISRLSPSFEIAFKEHLEVNSSREPLTVFQPLNTIASNPWLVSCANSSLASHQPDLTRTQESYLIAGVDNTETLRDWNEEFQSTRELPKETVQDRIFRERLTSKLFADYNEAAARGAILVARGEVAPLNPTECRDAQIFVYNNIFFSYGADGVGTFTSEGGDEAARVAVGKDVTGVKAVNQLDIPGLFTPGTIIVDYLGKRIVGQSIVPGIFKQREPGENQIDYGGVEGREIIAENEAFVAVFEKLSKALRVKKHAVWDKEGKKHVLEGSVETKGLLSTDGRKYVLDLYRLTPLDALWIEEHWRDSSEREGKIEEGSYPHRMTVLRPELIESYWRSKMGDYVKNELEKRRNNFSESKASDSRNGSSKENTSPSEAGAEANPSKTATENGAGSDEDNVASPSDNPNANCKDTKLNDFVATVDGDDTKANGEIENLGDLVAKVDSDDVEASRERERVDMSAFKLALNSDVFCGQIPQTEDDKAEWAKDEQEVKSVCKFLRQKALPNLIYDLKEAEIGFPMDGQSLSRLMHKRGINVRYLGHLTTLAQEQGPRLEALKIVAIQEMISRSFKHIANQHMRHLPNVFIGPCIAHLLNCLLGTNLNASPKAGVDEALQSLYSDSELSFSQATPDSIRTNIEAQVQTRFRYTLDSDWNLTSRFVQMTREISLKLGLQLRAKDYQFTANMQDEGVLQDVPMISNLEVPVINGHISNGAGSKKKKKNGCHISPLSEQIMSSPALTFTAEDVVNVVPIIKDACPKSTLAEEALEAGRMAMVQNQRELGQELLLESLSLHEQIYGIIHPEVARVYHQLSMLYYQLEEKNAAIELARKAVVVSERTLGIDSSETVLSYLNLCLFEHANSNTKLALHYMRHALELWKIIYGFNHPDLITTINNAAVMLQHLKHYHESRLWFETSLAISKDASGPQSVSTATLCFQLAQALALDHDSKGAVARMREAYTTFHSQLGPNDPNTKEAESWLEQLTQNAVSIARHAKDLQTRKLRRIHFAPKVTLDMRPQPQAGLTVKDTSGGQGGASGFNIDNRSIEELMTFIEDGEREKRGPTVKKRVGRSNPKRRGGGLLSVSH